MKNHHRYRPFLIGFYAWMIAVFFGAILLDIVYANRLNDVFRASETQAVFSEVSDVLLLLGFVTVLVAILAIAFSWNASTSRNLLIASLLMVMFEFFMPLIFFPFVQNIENLGIGLWLRLIPSGLGSILALSGLIYYFQQRWKESS